MTKADIVREIATQTGLEKQVVLQVSKDSWIA